MSRRSAWLVASAGMLAVTACSDSTPTTAPSISSPSFAVSENDHRHIMPTRANAWAVRAARPTKGGGTGISYHGGPVLQAGTKVAAIYWASATIYPGGPTPGTNGAGTGDGSLIGFFLSHIGGTPYYNINHSYTDGSTAIVNSVTYTQYWANNTNAPSGTTSISDAQMVAMLQSGFDSGKLTYDPNTLYHIFSSGSVNLGGGYGATPQYCAYHTHGTVTINGVAKTVLYSAMPYNYAKANYCSNQTASPNNDPGADAEVNTLVHETEETTTDMMGTAWYDNRGYENADKCAWTWGTTYTTSNGGVANVNIGGKDFLIQRNWLNAGSGGCYMSY